MPTVMTNLKISQYKVQLRMAELCLNPYDLCSKAGISYRQITANACWKEYVHAWGYVKCH